jgi:plastocyanin
MKLTRRNILVLCGVLVFFLFAGSATYLAVSNEKIPSQLTVTKTSRGFIPSKIIVNVGDTVLFKTDEDTEYWPASNAHPSHGQYPAFDPKRALSPDETWSMTFDTPGVWGFHDHLDSLMKGQIIVRGKFGEDRAQCLKNQKDSDLAPACWEAEVTEKLTEKGLAAAFTLVDSLYAEDPAFRRNCHDVMHILGAASYREFKNAPSVRAEQRTSYCGYGFYHGFIETMLLENGNSNFDAVKKYCTLLGKEYSSAASGPCFHGIGHAIFDSLPGSIWGSPEGMSNYALTMCEKALANTEERIQCASGVYNSLANALSARDYRLSFSDIVASEFCAKQKDEYRESCFAEVGIGYVREKHMERAEALAYIRSLKDYEELSQFFYYFSDETKRMMYDLNTESLADACSSLRNSAETQECIDGVLQGFRESSRVEKTYEFALPFCGGLIDLSQNMYCIKNVIERTSENITSTTGFAESCKRYSRPETVSVCENI